MMMLPSGFTPTLSADLTVAGFDYHRFHSMGAVLPPMHPEYRELISKIAVHGKTVNSLIEKELKKH